MNPSKKGYLDYLGHKIYYEIYGPKSSQNTPLLVLHGGPGSAHNYLLSLAKLEKFDRQVIFYDQLGCGESDKTEDEHLWTIDNFVKEVDVVRSELKLNELHLLGHSWGGMLAIEYLLTSPAGFKSAILASPMISMPLYNREVDMLKSKLPDNTYKILKKHEAAGTTATKEYQDAYSVYKKHHLFRGDEFPAEYSLKPENEGKNVYEFMWGVSEACGNGSMKDWDRIDELVNINIPTLVTSGQYDELTPWQSGIASNKIPNSELRIFTNSAHLPHIEREEDYIKVIEEFISKND